MPWSSFRALPQFPCSGTGGSGCMPPPLAEHIELRAPRALPLQACHCRDLAVDLPVTLGQSQRGMDRRWLARHAAGHVHQCWPPTRLAVHQPPGAGGGGPLTPQLATTWGQRRGRLPVLVVPSRRQDLCGGWRPGLRGTSEAPSQRPGCRQGGSRPCRCGWQESYGRCCGPRRTAPIGCWAPAPARAAPYHPGGAQAAGAWNAQGVPCTPAVAARVTACLPALVPRGHGGVEQPDARRRGTLGAGVGAPRAEDGRATPLERPGHVPLGEAPGVARPPLRSARAPRGTGCVRSASGSRSAGLPGEAGADPAAVRGLHADGGAEVSGRGPVGPRVRHGWRRAHTPSSGHGGGWARLAAPGARPRAWRRGDRATRPAAEGAPRPPAGCQRCTPDAWPPRPPRGWPAWAWADPAAGGHAAGGDRGWWAHGAWRPAAPRLRRRARAQGAATPWANAPCAEPWAAPPVARGRRRSERYRGRADRAHVGRAGPRARRPPRGEERVAGACRSDERVARRSRHAGHGPWVPWQGRSS